MILIPLGKTNEPGYSRSVMNATSIHNYRHPAASGAAGARASLSRLLFLQLLP
jgi:hypothetical protein